MPEKPISPLRQRMIDDMTARRFSEKVQGLRPARQNLRSLPRPIAGYGDERRITGVSRRSNPRSSSQKRL